MPRGCREHPQECRCYESSKGLEQCRRLGSLNVHYYRLGRDTLGHVDCELLERETLAHARQAGTGPMLFEMWGTKSMSARSTIEKKGESK